MCRGMDDIASSTRETAGSEASDSEASLAIIPLRGLL